MSTRPFQRTIVPCDHVERLLSVAHGLTDIIDATPGPLELVGLVDLASIGLDPSPDQRTDTLTLTRLDGPDPVAKLLGLRAPDEFWALGVASTSTARSLDSGSDRWPVTFVHLVARDGTSIDVLDDGKGHRHLEGPDEELRTGRVPDLCRRALGLPTAPPPCGPGPHLVDLWLERLVRADHDLLSLDWADAAALHPAGHATGRRAVTPSPAELVRATAELDEPHHWQTYLSVCLRHGTTPGGDLDRASLRWLDAGSFARWVLGQAPPQELLLEHLDAVLPRATADKVFATVRLSPRPPSITGL